MGHKRNPSAHQKQIRFFLFLFGAIMIIAAIGFIILMNRPWSPH
jgi:uncharacterized membrane protein